MYNLRESLILISVALVMLMEAIDSTILNTSLPTIALSLNVDPLDLKLALISYLMSMAIFIPISGWMADKYGAHRIFLISILVFTFSSLGCGFASTIEQLVFFRIVQGIGGSMTTPVGRLIILKIFPKHLIISVMGMVIIIASMGSILGPLLGGIISTHLSWHWIFWVNAPIGILTFIISYFYLPRFPKTYVRKLDTAGFIYFGCGLSSLTFGLSCLSQSQLPHSWVESSLLLACLALSMYFLHSIHQRNPIVHLDLFRIPSFRIAAICNLWFRVMVGGIPFLLPLLLQIYLGFSAELAGLCMVPIALGVIMMKYYSESILFKFGYRETLIMNTFLTSFILLCFTFIHPLLHIFWIGIMTFLYGFVLSLHYTSLNTLSYAKISPRKLSKATSIISTIQQLGVSFGVAMAALIMRLSAEHLSQKSHLDISNFHQCFIILSCLNLLQLFFLLALSPSDGEEFRQVNKAPPTN